MTKTDSTKMIDNTNEDMSGEEHVLFCNRRQEIRKVQGEEKGQAYEVPEHGNISIRFTKKYIGKKLRVFVEVD